MQNHHANRSATGQGTSERTFDRREILVGGGLAALALGGAWPGAAWATPATPRVTHALQLAPTDFSIGDTHVRTWAFNGSIPGPEFRVKQGRPVRFVVKNDLPEESSVHWHGIRLANAMDGVPGITQDPIAPSGEFVYEFVPPDAGTYFFHPHVGLQLDTGLYGSLIVEATHERQAYDQDVVIVLDDWLDGVKGRSPMKEYMRLRKIGMPMGMRPRTPKRPYVGLDGRTPAAGSLGWIANALESGSTDPGDVSYPYYLMNGRPPEDPWSLRVHPKQRIRLRVINAAADTIFSFRVGEHPLTVIACDGQDVHPIETDAVVLGMGERIDLLLDASQSGAHEITADALGKSNKAVGVLRYTTATAARATPGSATNLRVAGYSDLRSVDAPPLGKPSRSLTLGIGMDMMRGYVWTLGGQAYPKADTIDLARNETVDIVFANRSMMHMAHPMHLHGNLFAIAGADGGIVLKDTVLVGPTVSMPVRLHAANPGRWLLHCHNDYHMMSGMMRELQIRA